MIPSLRHMFSECRVVSFDIFDTLLKRHVKKPTDIFEIVQIQYNKEHGKHLDSFKNDRITAERNARLTAKQEDISLDDIYANLPYSDTEKKELKQIELSLEAIFLASNRRLKNLFEEAQKRGKEIIITSDMYLPHPFLLDILKREGYTGYKKLYLSSKEGLLKSTGNLFKLATTELNCKPKEILHIGDSRRGDFLAPLKLGVKVCPIKTFYQRLTYHPILKEQSLSRNILCSFLNNTIHGDHYFQLGYETLGPLLYGFCHWLHKKKQENGLKQLIFFSRDGEIMQKAYQAFTTDTDTQYIYVSRRSLTVPLLWTLENPKDIFDIIPLTRFFTLTTFFDKLGLDVSKYTEVSKQHGFDINTNYALQAIVQDLKFQELLLSIWPDVQTNSKQEFQAFVQYAKSLNLPSCYGIVDIGWKGTMQRSFEKLLALCNITPPSKSFYIGLTTEINNAEGYLFSKEKFANEPKVWSFLGLFEMLFSASHGSVKKYSISTSCPVETYPFEFEYNEKTRATLKQVQQIQKGALHFVDKFSKFEGNQFVEWDNSLAFEGILNLGLNTAPKDLNDISQWQFYDTTTIPLAQPHFSMHIGSMKRDFSNSAWKIAFLKRLLKVPLPYFSLYNFLRKIAK